MKSIAFELTFIFILLLMNGVFAMAEIAIVSVRKARLQQRAEAGDSKVMPLEEGLTLPSMNRIIGYACVYDLAFAPYYYEIGERCCFP